MVASMQATALRLNSTCSRTCQSSTRETRRFQACTRELSGPPRRGLTEPMAATLPSAESRACTSGIRSGRGIPAAEVSGWRARTCSRTSRRTAMSSALSTRPAPGGGDYGRDAAARREFAGHGGHLRTRRAHHVAQHAVHDVLLEDSQAAIRQQVGFVRLQLQASPAGDVAQHDPAEIGEARLGTDGRKLRRRDFDFVIRELVGPGFDLRQNRIDAGSRVFIGIGGLYAGAFHARAFESRSRNMPTSATTPTAWPVPRSLTLVATAGLMSTHTTLIQPGSMLPVAMECSMEPRHRTRPAPLS